MIDNEKLEALRELTESFSETSNEEFDYYDRFIKTNSYILQSCSRLVNEPTADDKQEAELCYVLLLAMTNLVILNNFSLIDKCIKRSLKIVDRLQSSLFKARLYTYLFCLEGKAVYKEQARAIINTWRGRSKTPEEQRLIRDYQLIIENR